MKNMHVDSKLEELVFLYNAYEGNPGIYELVYELGCYSLKIENQYKLAHEILSSLLKNGLVQLERYTDFKQDKRIEIVPYENLEEVLNNHQIGIRATKSMQLV